MGRKVKVPFEQFLEAYNKAISLPDLMLKLKITRQQVRGYIKRYHLETLECISKPREQREQLMDDVFSHYVGLITIRHLVGTYGLKRITIRRYIDRGIQKMYDCENPPRWPIPLINSQIKIVKSLIAFDDDAGYFGETDRIMAETGLSMEIVNQYQEYASEIMSERRAEYFANRTPPKRKLVRRIVKVPEPNSPIEQLRQIMSRAGR